eukprot:CAMPEP_0176102850 /NCGR_PEP_ID=MMETSP0120_2-20121206/51596_1 /TAXON_ID=160619 /ORGANISM="Kryptoperidinium foliaceum, Strain CCMP 1326" /LENGTH=50 /DNA_ID=CAMNT_0017436925 /DNA_START=41 /DNA_END=189 /DNA_ORIENTATION=+
MLSPAAPASKPGVRQGCVRAADGVDDPGARPGRAAVGAAGQTVTYIEQPR